MILTHQSSFEEVLAASSLIAGLEVTKLDGERWAIRYDGVSHMVGERQARAFLLGLARGREALTKERARLP